MVGCAAPVSSPNCKTALLESEEGLAGRVFNTVIKKLGLTNKVILNLIGANNSVGLYISPSQPQEKSPVHNIAPSPDKPIGIKADEICWPLFELVGFLLSDRLTTKNENS